MVKCIEGKNVGKETEWALERGSILSMKKVAIIILIVALVLANFSASAEVLLFENIVSMGGMNYFSNEVVNATENEYVVEIFSDEIMTTISPSIVRWRDVLIGAGLYLLIKKFQCNRRFSCARDPRSSGPFLYLEYNFK